MPPIKSDVSGLELTIKTGRPAVEDRCSLVWQTMLTRVVLRPASTSDLSLLPMHPEEPEYVSSATYSNVLADERS